MGELNGVDFEMFAPKTNILNIKTDRVYNKDAFCKAPSRAFFQVFMLCKLTLKRTGSSCRVCILYMVFCKVLLVATKSSIPEASRKRIETASFGVAVG